MEFVSQNEPKNRRNFPSAAVFHMVQWLENNLNEPYPRKEDMERLKELTGLSQTQIANWFANARRRFMKDQNILQRRRHNSYESVIFFSKPTLNYSKKISSLSTTSTPTSNSTQNPTSPSSSSQSPSSSIYSSPSFTCPSSPSFSSPSSSGSTSPTHSQNQAFSPSFFSAPVSAPSSPVFHSPETVMMQGSPCLMPIPNPLPLSVSESMVPVDRRRSAPDCLVAPLSSLSVLPLPPRPHSLPSMFDDDEEEDEQEDKTKNMKEGRKVQLPSMPCLLSVVEKSISQSHSPSHSHHFPSSRLLPPLPSIPPFPAAALSPAPPPPSVPAPAPPTFVAPVPEQHQHQTHQNQHQQNQQSSKTSPSSGRVYYF